MIEISTELGLWILDAYRRMTSQLQVIGTIGGEGDLRSSAAVIAETSPIDSKICLRFPDGLSEQNPRCFISLTGARFWFDPTGKPPAECKELDGAWRSFLKVDPPSGTAFLLGERFVRER